MQSVYSPHYLIRTKGGEVYYFYLNDRREVCYSIYKEGTILIKEHLTTEMVIDFSVAITTQNEIHLISITQTGKLLYYLGVDGTWNSRLLSRVDVQSNIYRYLSLFIDKNHTHIFCMKTNLLNSSVASIEHIYWNEKHMNKSTITSYMPGKYPSPYHVELDSLGNIHIVYKVLYKTNHQLYYNKFNISNKKWLPLEIVSDLGENHSHPYILIDQRDHLHLTWCTVEKNNFILKYKRKSHITTQRNKWSSSKTLSSENANFTSPIMIQEGSFLKVLCRQNNHIAEIVSQDGGETWIGTNKNKLYKTKNPQLIRYITNFDQDRRVYNLNHVYGELKDSIELFGVRLLHFNKSNNLNVSNVDPKNKYSPVQKTAQVDVNALDEVPPYTAENNLQLNNGINNNGKNDISMDNMDEKKLLKEIQVHTDNLIKELIKLNEFKNILQKKPPNSPPSLEEDSQELKGLYDKLKIIEKNIFNIKEEKQTLEETFKEFQSKLASLDQRISQYTEEYSILQQRIETLSNKDLNFIDRIKNLFK